MAGSSNLKKTVGVNEIINLAQYMSGYWQKSCLSILMLYLPDIINIDTGDMQAANIGCNTQS